MVLDFLRKSAFEKFLIYAKSAEEQPELVETLRERLGYGRDSNPEIAASQSKAVLNLLTFAKYFEIDEELVKLLMLTKLPELDDDNLELPFPVIFIEVKFNKNEYVLDSDNLEGMLILPTEIEKELPNGKIEAKGFSVYTMTDMIEKIWLNQCTIITKSNYEIHHDRILPNDFKTIKTFLMNFLVFLNDPNVEIVEVTRNKKNMERRIKHGKIPLPTSNIVKVKGQLKIYLDKLNSGGHFSYAYQFWVRGHFRTLRSDKWKNMRGVRIWIPPFIKGQGMLVDKKYLVKKKADGNNSSSQPRLSTEAELHS